MNPDECMAFTGLKLRESEKAVLFKIQEIEEQIVFAPKAVWIPLSQIDAMEKDPNRTNSDRIWVRIWLGRKLQEQCNE